MARRYAASASARRPSSCSSSPRLLCPAARSRRYSGPAERVEKIGEIVLAAGQVAAVFGDGREVAGQGVQEYDRAADGRLGLRLPQAKANVADPALRAGQRDPRLRIVGDIGCEFFVLLERLLQELPLLV